MLDYNDPENIALSAARIRALTSAASCIAEGDALGSHHDRSSVAQYLIDLASEIALHIEEAADRGAYELRRHQMTANQFSTTGETP